MLPEKVTISIISPSEDDSVYINSTLRNVGITVQSVWSKHHKDCIDILKKGNLHLIFMRTNNFSAQDEAIIDEIKAIEKHIPVILIHDEVNQKTLTITLQMGAHDLISMNFPDRLTILTCRELGSYLKAKELYKLRSEIDNFSEQLQTLKEESTLPAVILIDGIIVETNAIANILINSDKNHSLFSSPILDFIHSDDQILVRGALRAATNGNFSADEIIVRIISAKQGDLKMSCLLEPYVHEGETAIRLCLREIQKTKLVSGSDMQLDPLTNIFHRKQFIQSAQEALQNRIKSGVRNLVYIKLDSFKLLQEKLGILQVDCILEHAANALIETVTKGDVYGRFGSNVFAMLCHKGNQDDVESWAEHFQDFLHKNPCVIDDKEYPLTCSIGISDWQEDSDDFADALQRAKNSSNDARSSGTGKIKVNQHFKEITLQSNDFDKQWVIRLKRALVQNRFQLYQFPISSLRMTSRNMIDIYLRMKGDDGELILPNVFMPTAERNNLTQSLDRWVIGASIRYCQANPDAKMFVRLSKDSLLDQALIPWTNKILLEHNVPTTSLAFQIVEEDIFKYRSKLTTRLHEFNENGFEIAIEHFGKNPAHIELLEDYPIDYLKIDSTLIQGLTESRERQQIVKALCKIAGSKQIATIAEHVETADTMAVLYQLGADYMQGKFTLEPEVVLGSE